jgi:hypothetical protein
MRYIFILACVLSLSACVTSEAEWENYYRDQCISTLTNLYPNEELTEDEIDICMEFQRSGISWDFSEDHGVLPNSD